jgi:hypothetical protein
METSPLTLVSIVRQRKDGTYGTSLNLSLFVGGRSDQNT